MELRFLKYLLTIFISFVILCKAVAQICPSNCSTTVNDIECFCQQALCGRDGSNPSRPKLLTKTWYLYPGAEDGYENVALNFSWGPAQEATVKFTTGYQITVNLQNSTSNITIYFCLKTPLDYFKHVKAEFFYDRYGRSIANVVQPGDKYWVSIYGLPLPRFNLNYVQQKFEIVVPGCDHTKMQNVSKCRLKEQLKVSVAEIMCDTRTAVVQYTVPSAYGDEVDMMLCVGQSTDLELCTVRVSCNAIGPYNGTCYFQLPESYNFLNNYTVTLWNSVDKQLRKSDLITFRNCLKEAVAFQVVIIGVAALVVVMCAVIFCCIKNQGSIKKLLQERTCGRSPDHQGTRELIAPVSKPLSIYLIYARSCRRHTEVVKNFASYLCEDLGFNVIFEVWEQRFFNMARTSWIEKAMKDAHKIIVIWSPNATEMYQQYDAQTAIEDMFSPVVRRIRDDIMVNRNPGKYFFACFDYCSEDHFKTFRDGLQIPLFKIMDHFEMLYFQLVNEEKYHPGAVLCQRKVESYAVPGVTKHGLELKRSIDEMCEYAESHPYWYEETEAASCKCAEFPPDENSLGRRVLLIPPMSPLESETVEEDEHPSGPDHSDIPCNSLATVPYGHDVQCQKLIHVAVDRVPDERREHDSGYGSFRHNNLNVPEHQSSNTEFNTDVVHRPELVPLVQDECPYQLLAAINSSSL